MIFSFLKKFVSLPLRMDSLSPNAEKAEIYDAYIAERQARLSLEKTLAEKDANVERLLKDHSRELTDANTQLSQQIALRKQISDALVKSQTRLNQAMSATRLGFIDWDILHGQFYQSDFLSVFGDKEQATEELIKTLKRIIHPADYVHVRDTLNACLDGRLTEYAVQYRVQQNEQGWLWLEECGKVVDADAKGKALRILGTRRNIQSEVLRDEQVRLAKSVVDHTSEGVFVLDPQYRFLSVNPAFAKIIGYESAFLNGKRIQEISDTPQREEIYREIFQQVQAKDQWQGELLEKRYQGDYYPQWTQINAIHDEHGQIKYYAGMVSDLSFRKAADKKLDYLLNYDDLTKLANRVQFKDQLHRALVRYKDEGMPFALVMLDIDRFKQFNDSFGHEAADQLLCDIAWRLSKNIQKVDILARVGSNEFACVVSCSPTFNVMKFAQRLFDTVTHNHYEVAGQGVALSCSIGIALVPEHTVDIESLMQFAALAVQKAKFQGGDQIQLFDESLKSFSREKVEMEHALRVALETGQLEVFYQPKLDLKTQKIHAVESLVRWNHPDKGLVSPADFVNIAEESALITDLGFFVLKTACEQTQHWKAQGLGVISVAVNLSARQLREATLKEMIAGIISETGIQPEYLELELTESMIMEDSRTAVRCLQDLKSLGLKISVDDFGTGYSSLSYLKEFPVDTLKIDKSFVDGMELSTSQLAIVRAIIVLGHSLNLQVVAEGVENPQQLDLLRENHCDAVQGYLISKPLRVAEMQGLLEKQAQSAS
jgi:diguanylate cyclase (GGDEF)-like protein/PAS domain S-box-containing protein